MQNSELVIRAWKDKKFRTKSNLQTVASPVGSSVVRVDAFLDATSGTIATTKPQWCSDLPSCL